MLDLGYVRDHLPLISEKLRQRGMNPDEVLGDFTRVDAKRRQAITEMETLKAQRNRASEEVAKLKKAGQDASALIEQTKAQREQIEQLEKSASEMDAELKDILAAIPN